MQKLKLFCQYTTGALFLKANKEVEDQVGQWPGEYLSDEQIDYHFELLKKRHTLSLPELNFLNGSGILVERIYALSVYHPGLKPNVNVKVNVLRYYYPITGASYLLGCRPTAIPVPEPAGEWFCDPAKQEIYVEYTEYEKFPKKTVAGHQRYAAGLQLCYEALKDEIADFNCSIDDMIRVAIDQRKGELSEMRRIMTLLH